MSEYLHSFASTLSDVCRELNWDKVEEMTSILATLRSRGGRLMILGLGGSAGNASHMVNDVRKLTGIEAYAPTDNVSEFSARVNDDGWGQAMVGWLKVSKLTDRDAVCILSVGGGDLERNVSTELVHASNHAAAVGAKIIGIVGRDGGHAANVGDCVVVVPTPEPELLTPIAEVMQSAVWHALVSHPRLALIQAHWETLESSGA